MALVDPQVAPPSCASCGSTRTEVDTAADALIAIFDRDVLKLDPMMLARVARATEVPIGALKAAHERYLRGQWRAPGQEAAAGQPHVSPLTGHRGSIFIDRHPAEASEKECTRCGESLPVEEFLTFGKKLLSGAPRRMAMCHDCRRKHSRQRYLTVDERDAVNAVLTMQVVEHDGLEGRRCAACRATFVVGDVVSTNPTAVRHASCPAED